MIEKKINKAKKLFLMINLFICKVFVLNAQEITYGTGKWNPEDLGNHHVAIHVDIASDAIIVKIPLRRLDNVGDKDLILIDVLTKQRVKTYQKQIHTLKIKENEQGFWNIRYRNA